jgi:hypothetical protein
MFMQWGLLLQHRKSFLRRRYTFLSKLKDVTFSEFALEYKNVLWTSSTSHGIFEKYKSPSTFRPNLRRFLNYNLYYKFGKKLPIRIIIFVSLFVIRNKMINFEDVTHFNYIRTIVSIHVHLSLKHTIFINRHNRQKLNYKLCNHIKIIKSI